MTRRRPAPSADRIASSRVRTVARARSRLATLAQQIRSTKPTTPRNSIDVSRSSLPISASCIGSSTTPRPLFVVGKLSRQAVGDGRHVGAGGLERDAGLQAPDDLEEVALAQRGTPVADRLSAQMLLRPSN